MKKNVCDGFDNIFCFFFGSNISFGPFECRYLLKNHAPTPAEIYKIVQQDITINESSEKPNESTKINLVIKGGMMKNKRIT
jgi:hypothetical protein